MPKNAIWNKNLKALEAKDPDLASRVLKINKDPSCQVIRSKTGMPNVIVVRENDGILLYDNDDPIKYCKEYLDGLDLNFAPIVIFCGLGLGYHLDLFFKEHHNRLETKAIIIFEEDIRLFRIALEIAEFEKILSHPDIHFIIGEDIEEAVVRLEPVFLKAVHRVFLRSAKVLPLPGSLRLNEDYYLSAVRAAKNAAKQLMVTAGNDSFDSLVGLENILSNVKHIAANPGINLLYDKFKSKPAVVVASGPSLTKNMHLLNDLKDRALVICCDPSFKPIMKRGIRPDLVVSLERTPGTEKFFEDFEDFDRIYYAVSPVVMPAAFDTFKGQKIITYRAFSHFDWLEMDKGAIKTGPSVANMAFKVAKKLGCDPIILIGQDLAFGDDGNTHVKESVYGERDEYYHEAGVFHVEGNDGKPVKTNRIWDIFRLYYESDLTKYGGTCINATEGGARIRGTEIMPFSEAITKYCSEIFHPHKIIQEAISVFNSGDNGAGELKLLLKKVISTREAIENDLISDFKSLIEEINSAEEDIIEPYIRSGKPPDMERIITIEKEFIRLNKKLFKDNKLIYEIMAHTVQAYDTWTSIEINFLKDIYSNKDAFEMARIIKVREYLKDIGQYLVCTNDILRKTEETLKADATTGV